MYIYIYYIIHAFTPKISPSQHAASMPRCAQNRPELARGLVFRERTQRHGDGSALAGRGASVGRGPGGSLTLMASGLLD